MNLFGINDNFQKKVVIIIVFLGLGFLFAKFYQPQFKTVRIYKNALKDYDNGNYSNAYYLFSKIGYNSKLKPVAIYRQALCARALGDEKSELKNYQTLFFHFPKFILSTEAKYQAAQILIDDNPNLAQRYFKKILKSDIDEDYKIASEYYIARIAALKIRYPDKNKIFSHKKVEEVEKSFRNYLEKYPDGRLAINVAANWKKFNPDLTSADKVLIARAYYQAGKYKEAGANLAGTERKHNWALGAANAYSTFDYQNTKNLTETGVAQFADTVYEEDYNRAVDNYLALFEQKDRFKYSSKLFSLAKGKGKDYIWNQKCKYSPSVSQTACYRDLYKNFPSGKYSQEALMQVLLGEIKQHQYAGARMTARSFMEKYPKSDYLPFVIFWAGKIEQKYHNSDLAIKYYQDVVNNYPDNYYAYRSFWLLKGLRNSVIKAQLDYKPVIYPYKYPSKQDILYQLLAVGDYDMLIKFTNDDFIRSWVEYERGNYAQSVILARDAMAKLDIKPVKSDLRWRLVYPQNYYKQVRNFSKQYNNNDALMMAIIREESSFNPEAQSGAGAIGLMQLMPATAHDICQKNKIDFVTSYLFNPELNIKLGNLYYSTIRNMLENKDISAIAAYNGGIGAVSEWKKNLQYNDTDEFVEQIPYDETKNYVIKVFKSYWNYTRIYQSR